MKINGVEFDLERAAYDIGQIAAERALTEEIPLTESQIQDMLQAYVNTVAQVLRINPESLGAEYL